MPRWAGSGTSSDPWIIPSVPLAAVDVVDKIRDPNNTRGRNGGTWFQFTVVSAGQHRISFDATRTSGQDWDLYGNHGYGGYSTGADESDSNTLEVGDVVKFVYYPYWAYHDAGFSALTLAISAPDPPSSALSFGTESVANQGYIEDSAITTLQLPEATGGEGARVYSLSPDLPAGLSFDANTRQITGTPTAAAGTTTYTYTVTDDDSETDSLTFTIRVHADVSPTLTFTSTPQTYRVNTAIATLQFPAATSGNTPLTYSLSPALPAGLSFDASTRQITGTPTATSDATDYTYTVTDADGDTDSFTQTITVLAADSDPSFGSHSIADQRYVTGSAISTLQLPAATGGNGTLSYSLSPALPAGLAFDDAARQITGTPTAAKAETEYTYTATDADGDTATLTFDLTVAQDTTPDFGSGSISSLTGRQNSAVTSRTFPAATGGNGTLTYSLSPELPAGLSFNATTRVFSGTPTATKSRTTYTYTVADADGDTDTIQFDLTVLPPDKLPTYGSSSVAAQRWLQHSAITALQLPAATGGDGTLTYSLSPALPAGLSFNATTRRITGTPTESMAQTTYTLTATDADGDTVSITFAITVEVDSTPAFAAPVSPQRYRVGTTITPLRLPAAAQGNAPIAYTLSPALPAGLSFNATSRRITGTPTAVSPATTYTYRATDNDGDTADLLFTLTVVSARASAQGSLLVVHTLAEIDDGGTQEQFLWDGSTSLTFGGRTYSPTHGAISVSAAPSEMGVPDSKLTVTIPLMDADARIAALVDHGPLPVTLRWIYSTDGGGSYQQLPRTSVGRISAPRIQDNVLSLEIESYLGDSDRYEPLYWSDESQRARDPSDVGFSGLRALSQGVELEGWPP